MKHRNQKIRKDGRGMTLVELLVASAIMILLMGIISLVLARSFFVNKYALEQGLNNTQLQNSIRNFSANIREARQADSGEYLLKTAEKFNLVFYADADNDGITERVHYYLDGTSLKMGTAEPSGFPRVYPADDRWGSLRLQQRAGRRSTGCFATPPWFAR